MHILGGKMGVPFFTAGGSQLLWDSDLSPEGIAVKHSVSPAEATKLFAAAGGFWVDERSSRADTLLYGFQGGVEQHLSEEAKLTFGAGYYRYSNIKGQGTFDNDPFGNTAIDTDPDPNAETWVFAEDFNIVECFAELGLKAGSVPVAVYADCARNLGADDYNQDTGWLAGFKVGKAKKPGSWQFGYAYADVERDAVVGALCNSDFGGGGTGHQGHILSAGYQLTKCLQLGLTYFLNDQHGADPATEDVDYKRCQLDLKMKF
jgi:hypothetical protein